MIIYNLVNTVYFHSNLIHETSLNYSRFIIPRHPQHSIPCHPWCCQAMPRANAAGWDGRKGLALLAFIQWDDRLVGLGHVGTEFLVPIQAVNGLDWYRTNPKRLHKRLHKRVHKRLHPRVHPRVQWEKERSMVSYGLFMFFEVTECFFQSITGAFLGPM